jgi:sulfoxide reductase heme-binding subunit YedZ
LVEGNTLGRDPLGVTSKIGWVRRLGKQRWDRIHQLVYVSSAGGVIHYMIKAKIVRQELVIYAVVVILLLLYRLEKEVVWHSPGKFRKP